MSEEMDTKNNSAKIKKNGVRQTSGDRKKTPREYVHEAFASGQKDLIQKYTLHYFKKYCIKRKKIAPAVEPDIIAQAEEIFGS